MKGKGRVNKTTSLQASKEGAMTYDGSVVGPGMDSEQQVKLSRIEAHIREKKDHLRCMECCSAFIFLMILSDS